MQVSGDGISFKKACSFQEVEFVNGRTIIGKESTYNSAYVGTETIQAGQRIVLGDSILKMSSDTRKIMADTFKMTLARLDVDNLFSKRANSDNFEARNVKVTGELIGQNIFADTIKTNKLFLDSVGSRSLQTSESMTTLDLIVNGTAKVQNSMTIMGTGVGPNGFALSVKGGALLANNGIVSHTRNNVFQTMQIVGSGTDHDVCFRVDRNVDSLFEGDVTVEGSRLILDNSKLVTDNVVVTPLSEVREDKPLSGVMLTTAGNWETYKDEMVSVVQAEEAPSLDDGYDPVAVVQEAMCRSQTNYEQANRTVQTLVNPITYAMENRSGNVPKLFSVKNGLYRIDSAGNALLGNVVAEKGIFSKLEAYRFNVNKLGVDKLVTTSVASNVVHTDNLLKSEGIAEFDGSVNVKADVFMEYESAMEVAKGAKVTFQKGSELLIKDGAKFTLGSDTTMKMAGDVELDLNKVVFLDSTNGRRYRISFRDAHECEGGGIVMDYTRLPDEEPKTDEEDVEDTELDARELDKKLKSLGI